MQHRNSTSLVHVDAAAADVSAFGGHPEAATVEEGVSLQIVQRTMSYGDFYFLKIIARS